jgi:hypothetical protein
MTNKDTMPHPLFLTLTTNPQTITLPGNHVHHNLDLIGYSVSGAPSTAGVPDNLYYSINFPDMPHVINSHVRSDSMQGIPVAISGPFTEKTLTPPLRLLTGIKATLAKFRIELRDENGNLATFLKCVLWLKLS